MGNSRLQHSRISEKGEMNDLHQFTHSTDEAMTLRRCLGAAANELEHDLKGVVLLGGCRKTKKKQTWSLTCQSLT